MNLANRPRHVRLVLDALQADRAAIIGHSMGGYTPPGFDRAAYQPQLYREIEAFVAAHLRG